MKFKYCQIYIVVICFLFFSCDKSDQLKIDKSLFQVQEIEVDHKLVNIRAYENIVYVNYPADTAYQKLNIYIPEAYFNDGIINEFSSKTAPILFTNGIDDYLPTKALKPILSKVKNQNKLSLINAALAKGYVVVSAGSRGIIQRNGKETASIIDQKAAIRFLRYNKENLPGDFSKIIVNGTKSGGLIAALLGATGNSDDYEESLELIGAAKTSDDIFAVSMYAPTLNLDHADMAYEWQFNSVKSTILNKNLSKEDQKISLQLKNSFPKYLNGLQLKNEKNEMLTLDNNGEGNFKDFIKILLVISAQTAEREGTNMSKYDFLIYFEGKINDVDFDKYVKYVKRAKLPPAFDALDLSTSENELFGNKSVLRKHFTTFSNSNSINFGVLASPSLIRKLNPMYYINQKGVTNAKFWRIRHGTKDSEISLTTSIMFALLLENNKLNVNYYLPWDRTHEGEYDLPEYFEWLDAITK